MAKPGRKTPLLASSHEPGASRTVSPSEHLKTLIELLSPAGADRARRLIAALLLVPIDERDEVVSAIEKRIVELYDTGEGPVDPEPLLHIAGEIVQRDGYCEQVIRSYARKGDPEDAPRASAREQA